MFAEDSILHNTKWLAVGERPAQLLNFNVDRLQSNVTLKFDVIKLKNIKPHVY